MPNRPSRRFPSGDVALVFGKNVDGVHILRRRDENSPVEAGLLQPLVEGRPITGELVSMRRRDDMPFLFDVKSELPGPEAATETATETGTRNAQQPWPVEGRDASPYRKGLGRDFGAARAKTAASRSELSR